MCDYDDKCGDDGGDGEVYGEDGDDDGYGGDNDDDCDDAGESKDDDDYFKTGIQNKEPGNATFSCAILCTSLCLPVPPVMNTSPVCGNYSAAAKESSETSLAHSSAFT